jgi:zinc protease
MMGYEFFDHRFAERIAFLMANRVYGSGMFNCRLMKSLRTEKGYVYGVSSSMQLYEVGGEYYVTTSVRYDAVADTIRSIIEEMKAIKSGEKPIDEDELFEVINLYNAQFPDAYKDAISILDSVVLNAEIRGRSPNYVNEFIQAYNALNVKTVNEVFSKYSYPEKFVVVLVGQKDRIVENLEKHGYTNYEVIEFGK